MRGGISGVEKETYFSSYLRRLYYWSGMKRHVGDFVRRCLTCQQIKAEHHKPAGLL